MLVIYMQAERGPLQILLSDKAERFDQVPDGIMKDSFGPFKPVGISGGVLEVVSPFAGFFQDV